MIQKNSTMKVRLPSQGSKRPYYTWLRVQKKSASKSNNSLLMPEKGGRIKLRLSFLINFLLTCFPMFSKRPNYIKIEQRDSMCLIRKYKWKQNLIRKIIGISPYRLQKSLVLFLNESCNLLCNQAMLILLLMICQTWTISRLW